MLDEGEPDSKRGMAARRAGVGLAKSLEEMGLLVRRDALAGVAHRDLNVRVYAPKVQLHSAALRRELHRIDEEIPHHLLDAAGIAHDRGGPRIEGGRSEEHTSELQSHLNLVCRLLLEKKKNVRGQLNPEADLNTLQIQGLRVTSAG